MTAIPHDYATAPFGVWDAPPATEDTMDEREAAITRLMRPAVGATSRAQAEVLVDEIGVDTIRSESDELLAGRVANPDSVVAAPEQAVIAEVLAEVGDDPVKAQVALDAEKAGKNRVTLISALEAKISTPAEDEDGEAGSTAGVEASPDAAATSLAAEPAEPNEVTPAPGDPGAPAPEAQEAADGPEPPSAE